MINYAVKGLQSVLGGLKLFPSKVVGFKGIKKAARNKS